MMAFITKHMRILWKYCGFPKPWLSRIHINNLAILQRSNLVRKSYAYISINPRVLVLWK